jgi:hypothetical protein
MKGKKKVEHTNKEKRKKEEEEAVERRNERAMEVE